MTNIPSHQTSKPKQMQPMQTEQKNAIGLVDSIKHRIGKRYDSWVRNRAKPTEEITLSQRRIYIFLSREGWLYAALLLITFIAGVNYANNLVLGLCFYLASVLVITIHYTYAQLSGLHIKLLEVADAQADGQVLVRLQVSATGSKPHHQLRFTFKVQTPINNHPTENDATLSEKALVNRLFKKRYQKKQQQKIAHQLTQRTQNITKVCPRVLKPQIVEFYLPAGSRGKYYIPRLTISSVYPIGILRTWSYMHFSPTAWIWPKPLAFTQYGQDFVAESSQDAVNTSKKGIDDFDRLDNYVQGESMARVSWRHVASGRGMLTKHFADPVGQDVLLDYANMPANHHEAKLSQLSFAVQQLSQNMTPFMLKLPQHHLALNSGIQHEKNALLLLAQAPVLNTINTDSQKQEQQKRQDKGQKNG